GCALKRPRSWPVPRSTPSIIDPGDIPVVWPECLTFGTMGKTLVMARKLLVSVVVVLGSLGLAQAQQLAVLTYGGGGDWYANPTALPNLIAFCNAQIGTKIDPSPQTVEAGSVSLFKYPLLHMTGHGNVFFTDREIENLRAYLRS